MKTQETLWGGRQRVLQVGTFLLLAFGLATISFWTDLLGHSPALSASAAHIIPLANPRTFYLLGLVLGGALFSVFSQRLDFRSLLPQRAAQIIAGLLFAAATCGYAYADSFAGDPASAASAASAVAAAAALAPAATATTAATAAAATAVAAAAAPLAPRLIAIIALATTGVGFAWFSIQFLVQLAQEGRYSFVVGAIATGLLLKTILGASVSLLVPATGQIVIAVTLPLLATALLIASQCCLDSAENTVDLQELPKIPLPYHRALFLLLLINSLLRAVIRVMSSMGFWGDSIVPASQLLILDFLVLAFIFSFAAYFALVRQTHPDPILRFLPAFLIILAGFFVLDPQVLAMLQLNSWMAFILNLFVELFAHLFFWSIIVFGIRSLSIHPFRVAGLAITLYAVASALLTFAMPTPSSAYRLIAVLALYGFIVVLMFAFRLTRPAAQQAVPVTTDTAPSEPPNTDTKGINGEATALSPLSELAQSCNLSPRETEVFLLLAQGRSRPYIQQELFLADGTVKTHISRIYTKLGISNRQELITLVQTHQSPS
ncbi:MAG: helix-turn-helix transcriptional regulator [Coriobacteriales bacterium]|jgi:DNA-binding CsgD family transcriptional regulator|nr:helix-turn-helix transcriptional regulator [Coriobacteriales bacterium]